MADGRGGCGGPPHPFVPAALLDRFFRSWFSGRSFFVACFQVQSHVVLNMVNPCWFVVCAYVIWVTYDYFELGLGQAI